MTILFQVQGVKSRFAVEYDGRGYTVLSQDRLKDGTLVVEDGQPVWKPTKCAFYGSLRGACTRLLELGLIESEHQHVATLGWQMEAWCKRIEAAVQTIQRDKIGETS